MPNDIQFNTTNKLSTDQREKISNKMYKKSYQCPQLNVLGTLNRTTQGGSGVECDFVSQSNNPGPMPCQ